MLVPEHEYTERRTHKHTHTSRWAFVEFNQLTVISRATLAGIKISAGGEKYILTCYSQQYKCSYNVFGIIH